MNRCSFRRPSLAAVSTALSMAAAGCSGQGDFGLKVTVPQERHHVLTSSDLGRASVDAGKDGLFNVADAQRDSHGQAKAESQADPAGNASCSVDASVGGTGSAEFQLGRVLRYDGDSPSDAYVTFDVTYRCTVRGHEESSRPPTAALKAYVTDSNRRTLGKVMLLDTDSEQPPGRWEGEQSPAFAVTLQPGTAYHLVVAGRVEVAGDKTSGSTVALVVESLDIRLSRRSP